MKKSSRPGYVLLPLKSSQMDSALILSDSEEFRKMLRLAKDEQLNKINIPLLESLIEKRQELAQLLGYSSYSAMVLKDMMAKKVENVQKFHDDLRQKISSKAQQEINTVNSNVTSKYHNVTEPGLKTWDFMYYKNEYSIN